MSPLQSVVSSGPVQHMDKRVGRLTGASPCLHARVPRAFRVSVSVVLSIMQLLTLPPEPSLSLPLNMHPFPSPKSLSPPSSHKPSLPHTSTACLMQMRSESAAVFIRPTAGGFNLLEVTSGHGVWI